jgi:hypothetical protein
MTVLNRGDIGRTTRQFTANGATSVVVPMPEANVNSVYAFGLRTVGGTPAGSPYVFAINPGVSITVRAVSGDTSVYKVAALS